MTVVRATRSRRLLVAITLGLAAALPTSGERARAGTYEVVACDAAPGGGASSWVGIASRSMSADQRCPSRRTDSAGIRVSNEIGAGRAPYLAKAIMAFDAPDGASIERLAAQYSIHRDDLYWEVGIFADSSMLTGCRANDAQSPCRTTTRWPGFSAAWNFARNVHRVFIRASCQASRGCSTAPGRSILAERVGLHLFSATVRIRDLTPPRIWNTGDGPLTNGSWQRGRQFVGYAAQDNVGIRATRLYVDGVQRDDLQRSCDFTRRVPCPDVGYARYWVDTQALPDGVHDLRIEAVDTAGNAASYRTTFKSDNTQPDAPPDVSVDGGDGWRATNSFALRWTNPTSASPIAVARYELCDAATWECSIGDRRAEGITSIPDLTVPGPGDYTVRLWLEDAAGNVNPANKSVPVHLRFDDVAPGEAEPSAPDGWLNASESRAYDERIGMRSGEVVPVSGIAGYSVTTDGSDPDGTIDAPGGTYRIAELPEGATTFKARAISGSGVPSERIGSTVILVDKSKPTVDADGVPDPGTWQRNPVELTLRSTDQPGLSGLAPAPDGAPVESGAYIAYRVDGGELQKAPGGTARVVVADDGDHSIRYRAVDVAGNESDQGTARVRVDRTAPEPVVFERPDAADPRRVVVTASDTTSGVASGVIELRRAGASDAGGWQALPTTRDGDTLSTTLDDDTLAHAVYELRARVSDRAGNQAVGDRYRDGSTALVDVAAIRMETRLTAGLVGPESRTAEIPTGSARLVPVLVVPFGKSASARGQLTTAPGDPVAGASIEVSERLASAGSDFVVVDHVRTNRLGAFAYSVPPGPGRTVRFRYLGSPRERGSHGDVTLRVRAAATIAASRHSLHNGQAVTFNGRLLGRPIPPTGKLLDLQAFYRGRWRTFATPRAGSRGRWQYTYRFGATTGRLTYRFRVAVPPETGYPYELGHSRTVEVTVSG